MPKLITIDSVLKRINRHLNGVSWKIRTCMQPTIFNGNMHVKHWELLNSRQQVTRRFWTSQELADYAIHLSVLRTGEQLLAMTTRQAERDAVATAERKTEPVDRALRDGLRDVHLEETQGMVKA